MQNPSIETLKQAVKSLWEQKLGIIITNEEDNFFMLGGNSIQALEIIGEINNQFEINITVADFFDALEIENLAKLIQQNRTQLSATTSA
jgi:iturin family lipopeptide synthetase A